MGAFPYTRICIDCKHVWGGYWFSFNIETVLRGAAAMNNCPKCAGKNVANYKSKEELDWDEENETLD